MAFLESVILAFRQEAKVHIALESEVKEALIMGDKDLLLRVFNNLITNAIQAIPSDRNGEITIKITTNELDDKYFIAVRDNGMGIAKEAQASIFVPYFTTKTTGTGLGLAMTKQIIEQHRGKIWFETTQDEGTTFYVELERV